MEATTARDAGADVTVICPSDDRHPAGRFDLDGISVRRYPAPKEARGVVGYIGEYGGSLRAMNQAFKDARREGAFDIVHFCNPPDLLYLVATPAKKHDGSVLVFDQHDVGPELVAAKKMPFSRFFVAVARFFEQRTYKHSDHVIATNESYRSIAIARGGFSKSDTTVIRSGPSRDWADGAKDDRDWHRGRQHLIGYLGVMGRQEGIEYLIEAAEELVSRGLDIQLALIGSGPDRDRLESLVRAKGLDDRIEFHGRLSDDDMKSVLSDADVCVNPDEVNPMNDLSTMNKIIEYMALGKPIVQFDLKEGRFSAGDASVYARPSNDSTAFADAIETVLASPEDAQRMGKIGRDRFESELSWEAQGPRLVETYSRLLKRRPIPQNAESAT
ncbi:glycosyltransferase family 4 protein [Brevibacterium sediminis]|uniref:glycosyltransferase family 4 protein n=1 Tax=Brevibacterium sediminis TaxID=1857024 RepID=UPI003B3BE429